LIKNKTVIILGIGKSQIPILINAKKLGLFIIGVDINKNHKSKNLCDIFINASTYDFNLIKKKLIKLKKKLIIKSILNRSSGPPVVTTAKLGKLFNINLYPSKSAEIIINKHKLSKFCKINKIKYPDTFYKNTINFNTKNFKNTKYIIKPSLGLIGKNNIYLANNKTEIKNYAFKSQKASLNNYYLIQEFIDGRDVTLFSFVDNKKIISHFLLDEFNIINKNNEISDFGYSIPSLYSKKKYEKKIIQISKRIISKLLINKSIFIASFRIKNNEIYLIEIHLEMGGQLWYETLFPKSMNSNLVKETIKFFTENQRPILIKKIKPTFIKYFKTKNKLISDNQVEVFHSKSIKNLNIKIEKLLNE